MPRSSIASITGTAAAQRIAHHHDVRAQIQLFGAVALDELDAERA